MNKPKVTFEDLVIETTRRCNMKCAHCFRGDAQDVDIDYRHIDDLLDQTEAIGYLEITGGEPTLNLDALKYILNGLCKRGIPLFGFSLYINGLIYSEKFIEIIKRYKQVIDVSCVNCLKNGNEYQPTKEIGRCNIGISLDRYHEQHDICMEHYQKYKAALADYADVRMIIKGNRPQKIGRAKNLQEALDIDFKYSFSQKQKIELLSKDKVPACKNYNAYHMFHEDQKIICCRVCMNVYGDLSNECGNQWDWERSDSYPKICNVSDSIWDSLFEYNKDKIPCVQFQKLQFEKVHKELPVEQTLEWFCIPNAKDEPMHYQKEQMAELEKKMYALNHPKSLIETFENVKNEYINYVKAQENLRKAREHEAKNWAQIIAEANHHAYFDSDTRGRSKSQIDTDEIKPQEDASITSKEIINAIEDLFGLQNIKALVKQSMNKLNHDVLMETATPEMIEAISNDEEIKLIKESMKNFERLIQLFPDNSIYQKMLESDKRSLLSRELRILREANERKCANIARL